MKDRDILVYNQIFMERNFHETVLQPGVFTLNEGNVEAEKAILAAEATISALNKAEDVHMAAGTEAKASQEAAKEVLKESVWRYKTSFDNSALSYCFARLNTRDRMLDAVSQVALSSTVDTSDGLMAEASHLQGASDVPLAGLPLLSFKGAGLESDPILTEAIAGAGDSYLSGLIQELGNSDWVQDALKFENHSKDHCPLCQQALPADFYAQVRKVFDQTYKRKLAELTTLHRQYSEAANQLLRQSEAPV